MNEFERSRISAENMEKYDDVCFAMLMDVYKDEMGEQYLEENLALRESSEAEYINELDGRYLKVIDSAIKKKKRGISRAKVLKFAKRAGNVAAGLFLVAVLSTTVLFSTVEAFRVSVVDYVIDTFQMGDGSLLSVKANEDENEGEVIPRWLPDGYEVVEKYDTADVRMVRYSDGINSIRFAATRIGGIIIDNENADIVSNTEICGYEAVIVTTANDIIIYWFNYEKDVSYQIWSDNIDVELIMAVAESCYH